MKRQFTIIERAIMLQALPKENNILTLRIIRKLKEDFEFTENELSEIKVTSNNDLLLQQTLPAKEIEIGEKAFDVIANTLRSLNDRKALTENHLSLYEYFVENVKK